MDKLRFYDFMSFFLPGAFVALFLGLVLCWMLPVLPACLLDSSITDSLVFLVVVFLIGHVVQTYGNEFENREVHYWGWESQKMAKLPDEKSAQHKVSWWAQNAMSLPFLRNIRPIQRALDIAYHDRIPLGTGKWFSQILLDPQNTRYDAATKSAIVKAAQDTFPSLVPLAQEEQDQPTPSLTPQHSQLIFDLAYRFILQKQVAPQTDDFNAQYGFYRGMCVAIGSVAWAALVLGVALLIIGFVSFIHVLVLPTRAIALRALVALFIALLSFSAFRTYRKRYERFAFYFANSVFMNFLVFRASKDGK